MNRSLRRCACCRRPTNARNTGALCAPCYRKGCTAYSGSRGECDRYRGPGTGPLASLATLRLARGR